MSYLQLAIDSDNDEICCPDNGIYSGNHVVTEKAPKPPSTLSFSSCDFRLLKPLNINNDAPISEKNVVATPRGDAPMGFPKPPNVPYFSHMAYHFTKPALIQISIAVWLLSSQLLYNDRIDVIHECKLGFSKVVDYQIIFINYHSS